MPTGTPQRKICGVYVLINIANGKEYIGSSVNILHRWGAHRNTLNNGTHHNAYLLASWQKYGECQFKFLVLEETTEMAEREKYYIQERSPAYNLTRSVDRHWVASEETRKKMSASGKKRPPRSAEARAKLSEALRGNTNGAGLHKISEAGLRKLREGMIGVKNFLGRKHTREAIEKMRRKRASTETRKKMGAWQVGRIRSDETRRKISMARMGMKPSEETRMKISLAQRERQRKARKNREP